MITNDLLDLFLEIWLFIIVRKELSNKEHKKASNKYTIDEG